jgi:hypothetical protein
MQKTLIVLLTIRMTFGSNLDKSIKEYTNVYAVGTTCLVLRPSLIRKVAGQKKIQGLFRQAIFPLALAFSNLFGS